MDRRVRHFIHVIVNVLFLSVSWLFLKGIGIWGVNIAHWLGLRHRQLRLVDRYRPCGNVDLRHIICCSNKAGVRSINRFAEAMTPLFAVDVRGMFPLIHTSGKAVAGGLLVVPVSRIQMSIWPQFRSARSSGTSSPFRPTVTVS